MGDRIKSETKPNRTENRGVNLAFIPLFLSFVEKALIREERP